MKSLKVEGLLFIQTHNCFPLHAYPSDYYRYTTEALEALFPITMGFEVISSYYEFPAQVVSCRDSNTKFGKAFLNVCLFGKKIEETPKEFIYEL